jgi:chemotaxis response regulator CheB
MHALSRDEVTGVVYGLPKGAVKLGAVGKNVPLPQISRAIFRVLERGGNVRKISQKGD